MMNRQKLRKPTKVQKWPLFGNFWANFGYFLRLQSYDFDAIAHVGAPLGAAFFNNRVDSF